MLQFTRSIAVVYLLCFAFACSLPPCQSSRALPQGKEGAAGNTMDLSAAETKTALSTIDVSEEITIDNDDDSEEDLTSHPCYAVLGQLDIEANVDPLPEDGDLIMIEKDCRRILATKSDYSSPKSNRNPKCSKTKKVLITRAF